MGKKWLCGLVLGLMLSTLSWAQGSPVGLWQTFDQDSGAKKAVVQISELGGDGQLVGKIVKLQQKPGAVCVKCRGVLKNKPIKGMMILWGLMPDGENEWGGGEILDPQNGKTYSLKITLSADGQTLKLRGYLGFSLLGRTQTWKRVK